MRKLWKRWMNRVEIHNSKQTYATYEECWNGLEIFYPFVAALINLIIGSICKIGTIALIWTSVMYFVLIALALVVNWFVYD